MTSAEGSTARREPGNAAEPDARAVAPDRAWAPTLHGALAAARAVTRAANRLAQRIGLADHPPAHRWLVAALVVAMLSAIAGGLALARGVPESPYLLLISAATVALSQTFMLRLRSAGGGFAVGWGETALIICLCAAPAGWIPAAVGVGALLGQLGLLARRRVGTAATVICNTAITTLGGTAGVLVAGAVAPTYRAPMTPAVGLALCLGAVAYFTVTAGLVAATVASRGSGTFRASAVHLARTKALMLVGNVVAGLATVALVGGDWRWVLLLLPPFLWLLHQAYSHRLRADEERRTWQVFARVTRALNQPTERAVAVAGIEGAMALLSPRRAEVATTEGGVVRRYAAERGGPVYDAPADDDRPLDGPDVVARDLVACGVTVGHLRLWLDEATVLTSRQQLAFSSFADALAAALHDAATHRELQAVTERSSHDAEHDPLTGLPNRAAMLERGNEVLRSLDRHDPIALLLLDVDRFKEVNDTLGHAAGDELLRITAERLRALTDPDALLARLGGDEFALLLTAVPDTPQVASGGGEDLRVAPPPGDSARSPLRHALRFGRHVAEQLAAPTEVAGVPLSVEASVGVVVAPAGSADISELLRRADIAMYQAKRGGASVAWYDSAKDAASTDRLTLLAELREALAADDQLVVELQPAVDLVSGRPSGVEALVRWRHPRRGRLVPAEFLSAIEGSELLGPFTRRVFDLALGHAARWAAQGFEVPLAVNISPRSLLDPSLPADIAELLHRHRVPAHRLVLEITETVVMSELEVIDEVLAGLRELGVQIAVDDFGTGYSSLTFLTRIAVDEVKVDRTFVAKMADSPEAAAIVRTTVGLGRELGLRVVAEGVETAEQRRLVTAMGCSAAQGFHFFPPLPAEKIGHALRTLLAAAPPRVVPLYADGGS
jgi:predicted signal transduction protein with EAL and GGDEF domain